MAFSWQCHSNPKGIALIELFYRKCSYFTLHYARGFACVEPDNCPKGLHFYIINRIILCVKEGYERGLSHVIFIMCLPNFIYINLFRSFYMKEFKN